MRNQTISTSLSEAAELLAAPIDPAGWLARPDSARRAGAPGGPESADRDVARSGEQRRNGRPARRSARPYRRIRSGNRTIIRPERLDTRARDLRVVAAESNFAVGAAATMAGGSTTRRVLPDVTPDGYRMSRWARLAITVTVLAAAVVLTVSLTAGSAPARLVDVTVGPGDTLWSIATGAAPDRDPRAVIDEIRELNDVPGTVLPVGVVLRVPVSAE